MMGVECQVEMVLLKAQRGLVRDKYLVPEVQNDDRPVSSKLQKVVGVNLFCLKDDINSYVA